MAFKLGKKLSVLAMLLIVWLLLVAMITLPHHHTTASNAAQPEKVSSTKGGFTEYVGYRDRRKLSRGPVFRSSSPPGQHG